MLSCRVGVRFITRLRLMPELRIRDVFNPPYVFVSYNLIITLTNLRLSFYT
jgi:hypothetical protein